MVICVFFSVLGLTLGAGLIIEFVSCRDGLIIAPTGCNYRIRSLFGATVFVQARPRVTVLRLSQLHHCWQDCGDLLSGVTSNFASSPMQKIIQAPSSLTTWPCPNFLSVGLKNRGSKTRSRCQRLRGRKRMGVSPP